MLFPTIFLSFPFQLTVYLSFISRSRDDAPRDRKYMLPTLSDLCYYGTPRHGSFVGRSELSQGRDKLREWVEALLFQEFPTKSVGSFLSILLVMET